MLLPDTFLLCFAVAADVAAWLPGSGGLLDQTDSLLLVLAPAGF